MIFTTCTVSTMHGPCIACRKRMRWLLRTDHPDRWWSFINMFLEWWKAKWIGYTAPSKKFLQRKKVALQTIRLQGQRTSLTVHHLIGNDVFLWVFELLTGSNSVSLSGHPKQSHNVRSSPRCTSLITISMYSSRLVLFDGWCKTTEIPTQPVQSAASLNQWPPLGVSRFAVQKRKKNTFKWANIHRVVIHSLHAGATAVQGLPNLCKH